MRKLLILFFGLFLLIGCKSNKESVALVPDPIVIHDTVWNTIIVVDTAEINHLQRELKEVRDSMTFYRDSVNFIDWRNARRIEKIQYYINITEKNSNNKQFFFGWIKRAMSED